MCSKENLWIMAFDFGQARIGVAIGNTLLKIPHPLVIITGKSKFEKLDKIRQLIDKWRPTRLVVGMPSGSDCDNENINTNILSPEKKQLISDVRRFSNRLKENFKLSVDFVNEEFTSSDAEAKLEEQSIMGKEQKGSIDALAACSILQRYFDTI